MAQLFATGPCALFVQPFGNGSAVFLGHGERAPVINIDPKLNGVKCDLGGDADFDLMESGESGRISVEVIRFNWPVLRQMQARTRNSAFPTAVGGTFAPGQRGTLLATEGCLWPLWVAFGFGAKAVFANAATGGPMPLGYRFPYSYLQPETIHPSMQNAAKISLQFGALSKFFPTVAGGMFGAFVTYDEDMTGIAGVTLN